MKAAVVAIGRRENDYAREFVEHHLSVGFDSVIIADNNHGNEERFEDVLDDYIADGLVIVENYRGKENVQRQAYNELYERYGNIYDWLAFFDFDEQLQLNGGTLADLLDTEDDMVLVNWQCYGDNGYLKSDGRRMSEQFAKPLPHPLFVQYQNHAENDHLKSILRTCKGFRFKENPHTPTGVSPFRVYDPNAKAVLRHYITKTATEWVNNKMRRGTGSRSLAKFYQTYTDRFFKYNERTPEKEKIMNMNKKIAIIHYNTPEMTMACIQSLRNTGCDWPVVIFDNSDKRGFTKRMKDVKVINNRQGQIIDFEKELAKYPDKCDEMAAICGHGSVKHMLTVQKLWELLPDGFILVESDTLIKKDIRPLWRPEYAAVGMVQWKQPGNKMHIPRLLPFLCYMNVPVLVQNGAKYFDPDRCWALQPGGKKRKGNWYDTGAALLEDIMKTKPALVARNVGNLNDYFIHYKSASWPGADKDKQMAWLEKNKSLWSKP